MWTIRPRRFLKNLFGAAISAADPVICVPSHLPSPPKGRTVVVGAGKAAAVMARAVEDHWSGPLTGMVVTRYGHSVSCKRIRVVEAGHPIPDQYGVGAAKSIIQLVSDLGPDDLVICLLSGGGSALLTLPTQGVSLWEKKAINRALLKSGATISEINCIRKHLSDIKGGRLALAAAPAKVVSLTISDVPGDDPSAIASGPTVADPTSSADARDLLRKYRIKVPANVNNLLKRLEAETPKPGDSRLRQAKTTIVASPQQCLEAAADAAKATGITPYILSDRIEGESRDVAQVHAAIARHIVKRGQPFDAPALLLSGGETTVSVRGDGRGGPNTEFLLALALGLDGQSGVHAIACDTDGIDGTEDNAGAFVGPRTLQRATKMNLDARKFLEANDGYGFFDSLGDLLVTGPTLTNVNDFRAILITPKTTNGAAA